MIPLDPYFWTGVVVTLVLVAILIGVILLIHERLDRDVRGVEKGDLIPIGEEGELQRVRQVYEDRAGGITTIETESHRS